MKRLPPVIHKDDAKFSEFKAKEVLSAQKETRLMNERKPLDLTGKQDQMGKESFMNANQKAINHNFSRTLEAAKSVCVAPNATMEKFGMSMYQHPEITIGAKRKASGSLLAPSSLLSNSLMNERRPLDLRDGSPDLDGLYLVEESSHCAIAILGDEPLPNGLVAKGRPCFYKNGVPEHVSANLKSMLSALAAMEKV